jgi:1-deoxy-D-xylulose 5-phosphate reductoisomerase
MMSSGFTGVESKFNWHMSAAIKSDSSEFWNKRLEAAEDTFYRQLQENITILKV